MPEVCRFVILSPYILGDLNILTLHAIPFY